MTEKSYWLITDMTNSRSAVFHDEFKTRAEAEFCAQQELRRRSIHDIRQTDAMFVCAGYADEDGALDWSTIEDQHFIISFGEVDHVH